MSLKIRAALLLLGLACAAIFHANLPTTSLAQEPETDVNDDFFADMEFLKANTKASLLFVPFGSNKDFDRHGLSPESTFRLCGEPKKQCGNIGINFGTIYRSGDYNTVKDTYGMNWSLEIADTGRTKDVVEAINMHSGDFNMIVRFGTASGGLGATADPNSIILFLTTVANQVGGKEFYAIAGPNEPDIETWAAPDCGRAPGNPGPEAEQFYTCVGPKLAKYMNDICNAKNTIPDLANVKLLTPAFNMTSHTFAGITQAMETNGARFDDSCIDAIAGNLYPAGKSMAEYWEDQGIGEFASNYGKPVIITETGPMQGDRNNPATNPNLVSAYPISGFLPFDADDLDYYLQPIAGLTPNSSTQLIREDLASQGYQAYCATPRYGINPSYGSEALIDKFLRQNSNGVMLTVTSDFEMDIQNGKFPLFRDVEGNRWLTSSIEEYWSYTDVVTPNYRQAETNSAPINSLLNQTQRCTQSVKTLRAIEEMCEKLRDPDKCPLYERDIPGSEEKQNNAVVPGTAVSARELLASYDEYSANTTTEDTIESYCQRLMRTEAPEPELEKLKKNLLIAPLNIDRAYRLGFLVASLRQRRDETNRVFNFLSKNERGGLKPGTPSHEVVIIAFKLPDILTNKGKVAAQSDESNQRKSETATGWNDPALLTRNVLLPQSTIDRLETEGIEQREEVKTKANDFALQTEDNSIYCLAFGDAPDGATTSKTCLNPLGKAVVDIVNAHELNCGNFVGASENSHDISDPAGLLIRNAPLFTDQYGLNLIANLFNGANPDQTHTQLGRADQGILNFVSNFRIERTPWGADRGSDSTMDFYLVYPVGYDLETVEDTISGTFFTSEQKELLEKDEYFKKFFELQNVDRNFSATTASHSFEDQENCPFDDTLRRAVCEIETFTVSVSSDTYDTIKVLGGRLGFWMRTIQRALNPLESDANQYFTGCRTTEEFLLGKCGRTPPQLLGTQSPLVASYCGARSINNLTNRSENLVVVEVRSKKEVDRSIILDNSLSAKFKIAIAARFVDGATLVTKNVITHQNPGQNSAGRCGSSNGGTVPADNPTLIEIWRLPLEFKDRTTEELKDFGLWNAHGHILRPKLEPGAFTNATINVMVQPGVYGIRVQGSACYMPGESTVFIDGQEQRLLNDEFFIFDPDPNASSLATDYCGKLTINSGMAGGGYNDPARDTQVLAGECNLEELGVGAYPVKVLNSACGGSGGSPETDFWDTFINAVDIAESIGSSPQVIKDGLQKYREIFGMDFRVPQGGYNCTTLFPNTFQKSPDCSSISNGDVQSVGSIGDIPEFKIRRWKHQSTGNNLTLNPEHGAEITFRMPEDPLVIESINAAAAQHGCDPLLLLATLNSESFSYHNVPTENHATAMGIAQFTAGSWTDWWGQSCMQPSTFIPANSEYFANQPGGPTSVPANRSSTEFRNLRTNIPLAIDATCRKMLWSGVQNHSEENQRENFIISFALQSMLPYCAAQDPPYTRNAYRQIWNRHSPQADYVFRLWAQLRAISGAQAVPMPADYDAFTCGARYHKNSMFCPSESRTGWPPGGENGSW